MKNANDFKEEIKKEEIENVITTLECQIKRQIEVGSSAARVDGKNERLFHNIQKHKEDIFNILTSANYKIEEENQYTNEYGVAEGPFIWIRWEK